MFICETRLTFYIYIYFHTRCSTLITLNALYHFGGSELYNLKYLYVLINTYSLNNLYSYREEDDEIVECDNCGASVHEGKRKELLALESKMALAMNGNSTWKQSETNEYSNQSH